MGRKTARRQHRPGHRRRSPIAVLPLSFPVTWLIRAHPTGDIPTVVFEGFFEEYKRSLNNLFTRIFCLLFFAFETIEQMGRTPHYRPCTRCGSPPMEYHGKGYCKKCFWFCVTKPRRRKRAEERAEPGKDMETVLLSPLDALCELACKEISKGSKANNTAVPNVPDRPPLAHWYDRQSSPLPNEPTPNGDKFESAKPLYLQEASDRLERRNTEKAVLDALVQLGIASLKSTKLLKCHLHEFLLRCSDKSPADKVVSVRLSGKREELLMRVRKILAVDVAASL